MSNPLSDKTGHSKQNYNSQLIIKIDRFSFHADADPMPLLLCHALTPAAMVRAIDTTAQWSSDGHLQFSYRLSGDMARLLIPAPSVASRGEALWEHTCFEAFIAVRGSPAYLEYNFSPSGQWASYAFADYRQPDVAASPLPTPKITATLTEGRLELLARIASSELPPPYASSVLQIGLSAVIENTDTVDGNRSYWALSHQTPRPDFHLRACFTLELSNP
ncbi:MAG: DOMON-like domain-containing protein [Betaproteobacteria bacterium]